MKPEAPRWPVLPWAISALAGGGLLSLWFGDKIGGGVFFILIVLLSAAFVWDHRRAQQAASRAEIDAHHDDQI